MPISSEYKSQTKSLYIVQVAEYLKNHLQYLHEIGFKGFDCSEKSLNIITTWGQPVKKQAPDLKKIQTDMENCFLCRLSASRKNIIFGTGNPDADLMFVGGRPSGMDAESTSEPFAGEVGELLEKIINAIKMSKDEAYFCNVIKCRTPVDQDPMPDEISACARFLEQQIDAVKPVFICALGEIAAGVLLKTDKSVSALRGRFYNYKGIKILPTYHPAYLLRYESRKRDVWEDMKMLMREMKRSVH
ncbi:uracil-DNA glycosylase [Desulfosarcina sp. BuS5]|uniref:uracil-DNA glycosylase n=1 Tax=Desulfosarcina sp. BuS5 TaxID=933262 RepID=UPI0006840559|nr:uracil-DNA glycosylase [Desulfosarcina sp. BuS5]WDN88499.1 uracil-DNA glycosylase [Desulfosarcina sp. BuS5]